MKLTDICSQGASKAHETAADKQFGFAQLCREKLLEKRSDCGKAAQELGYPESYPVEQKREAPDGHQKRKNKGFENPVW
jgi:hypothetical protein